jgi:type VI secretion system protein ImpL
METRLLSLNAKDDELLELFKTYLGFIEEKPGAKLRVKQWLVEHWQSTLSGKASEIQQLELHLNNLLAQPGLSYNGNKQVVASARSKLKTTPPAQRLYSSLRSQYRDINTDLYSVIGPDTPLAFNLNQQSPTLNPSFIFTKQGYKDLDLSADSPLINNMSQDRWIYGDDTIDDFTDSDKEALSEQLKKLYYTDYNNSWSQYLNQLTLKPLKSMSHAVETLSVLADPIYSPLLTSLEAAANNTQLQPAINNPLEGKSRAADKLAELANKKTQPTPVDKKFSKLQQLTLSQRNQPARISHYLEIIGNVQMYIAEIDSAPDQQEAAFNAAKSRYSGEKTPLNTLMIEARTAPHPINEWLKQIADDSWKIILADSKTHINQLWKQQVFTNYQRYLINRYPLTNANNEIPIDDFNSYFSPSGIENTFITEHLTAFINTQKWQNKLIDGRSLNISPSSLRQFKNASTIRRSLYQKGDDASVGFKLEPAKLDSSVRQFELSIGNKSLQYSHGPRISTRFNWQGGIDLDARIHFEDLNNTSRNEQYQGDWALFRMLDDANIRQGASRNYFTITFNKDGREADFKLIAISAKNPFNRTLFNSYRCPERL